MTLIAAPARSGTWLDTDEPLSDAVLADVAAGAAVGIARYIPLPGNNPARDSSEGEIARICGTRKPDGTTLQCLLVQHCRLPKFNDLTRHPAALDAGAAAAHALRVSYPRGAHLACPDFEGLYGEAGELRAVNTAEVATAWLDACQAALRAADFRAMLYHGYDVPLPGLALYQLPGFDSYWRGLGGVDVAVRGDCLRQGAAVWIHGVEFDTNTLAPDHRGDVPMVAQLAP